LFSKKTKRLEELNNWWAEKAVKPKLVPVTRRTLFDTIKKDFNRKQIQILVGLRRTGKSTILYQFIDEMIKKGQTLKYSLLYF
jgi:predicted AAA+ superfamily ATPase